MAGIYTVLVRMAALGQQMLNRYDYVSDTALGTPTSLELATLLGFIPVGDPAVFPADTFFDNMRYCMSDDVSFLEVQVSEIYSTTDFYTLAYSPAQAGKAVTPISAPFLALGLFSNRVRSDIRRGFKRLPGVGEAMIDDGGTIAAGTLANLVTFAANMSETLSPAGAAYQPAVLQFEEYVSPRGNKAYRKYATRDGQLDHAAYPLTWAPYETVRSQVSRQIGRGS